MTASSFRLDVHPFTDRGRRDYQEDFFYTDPPPRDGLPWLGAVADGMGGHVGGGIASQAGIHAMKQAFDAAIAARRATAEALVDAVTRGHEAVLAAAQKAGALGNMGSTVSAFAIDGATLHWCSAGDSRIYLCREQRLLQLTRDFTLAEDMRQGVEQGAWTQEDIEGSPQRNALTSFMGTDRWRHHDGQMALQHGDLLVACSDGVYGTLGSDGLLAACSAGGGLAPAQQIAADMLKRVLDVGKSNQDNSTAVVVRYLARDDGAAGRTPAADERSQRSALPLWGGGLAAVAVAGVVGWIGYGAWTSGPVQNRPAGNAAGGTIAATAGGVPASPASGSAAHGVPTGSASPPDTPASTSSGTQEPAAPAASAGKPPTAAELYAANAAKLRAQFDAGELKPTEVPAVVKWLRNGWKSQDGKEPAAVKSKLDQLLADAAKKNSTVQAGRPTQPPNADRAASASTAVQNPESGSAPVLPANPSPSQTQNQNQNQNHNQNSSQGQGQVPAQPQAPSAAQPAAAPPQAPVSAQPSVPPAPPAAPKPAAANPKSAQPAVINDGESGPRP